MSDLPDDAFPDTSTRPNIEPWQAEEAAKVIAGIGADKDTPVVCVKEVLDALGITDFLKES